MLLNFLILSLSKDEENRAGSSLRWNHHRLVSCFEYAARDASVAIAVLTCA
jgi:hypothetical protein